ncbi:hypothetical protein MRX96_019363 [Rhipicephalus microplus]
MTTTDDTQIERPHEAPQYPAVSAAALNLPHPAHPSSSVVRLGAHSQKALRTNLRSTESGACDRNSLTRRRSSTALVSSDVDKRAALPHLRPLTRNHESVTHRRLPPLPCVPRIARDVSFAPNRIAIEHAQ